MEKRLVLIVVTLAFLLTGCAMGNKMIGSWKDPGYTGPITGKILVVGVAHNPTVRRIFEDSLVHNLQAAGADAVAGYTVNSERIEPNEGEIRKMVRRAGAAAVLVTHAVGSDEKTRYFPAIGGTFVNPGYYGGLYSYYPRVYSYVYMPAQTVTTEMVTLETGLYAADTGQLIWIGRTEAMNPEMTRKYYTALSSLFVKDLRKEKLL
jgi:predicted small secreted protein